MTAPWDEVTDFERQMHARLGQLELDELRAIEEDAATASHSAFATPAGIRLRLWVLDLIEQRERQECKAMGERATSALLHRVSRA